MIKFCTPKFERTGLMELKRAKMNTKDQHKARNQQGNLMPVSNIYCLRSGNQKHVGKELHTT